jgi:hypothetical protein
MIKGAQPYPMRPIHCALSIESQVEIAKWSLVASILAFISEADIVFKAVASASAA